MRILILGVSGLIGSGLFNSFSRLSPSNVAGTIRQEKDKLIFSKEIRENLILYQDIYDTESLLNIFENIKPEFVINCIGITKHNTLIENRSLAVYANAYFPIKVSEICKQHNVKMVQISTDCIFSGSTGNYTETDIPDSTDLYGQSKALGEYLDPNSLILRTSTIGHECKYRRGLLEWFMHQKTSCKGYTKAIFSGLTTHELSNIIFHIVNYQPEIRGKYNVGSDAISKYDLLSIIASEYNLDIKINKSEELMINRSLNSDKLFNTIKYEKKSWLLQIKEQKEHFHLWNF